MVISAPTLLSYSKQSIPPFFPSNTGIDGIRVKIFGTSMDSPGRAELLGMQGHMGYTSCCVCKHCFSAGIGTAKTCNFDGYRRFLKQGSRGRRKRVHYCSHTYEYEDDETRLKPKFRDDTFVRTAVAFVKQRHAPFLGHKGTPMLARWPGFNWYRMNPPDIMHGTFTLYIQAQCILTHTHCAGMPQIARLLWK